MIQTGGSRSTIKDVTTLEGGGGVGSRTLEDLRGGEGGPEGCHHFPRKKMSGTNYPW